MDPSRPDRRRFLEQTAALAAFAPGARAATKDPAREWHHYGGDAGAGRYSPLDQINRSNVKKLKVAWVHHTEDSLERPATTIESTPLVVDGVMYITTAMVQVRALDPATGKVLWNFNHSAGSRRRGSPGVNRAVAFWEDPGNPKDRRIYVPILDRVYCLNATTGKLIPGFANEGSLDLKKELDADRPELSFRHTSPVVLYKDMLITGGGGGDAPDPQAPGHIRGYDARTGKRRWIFHTIPKPGEFGHDTWGGDSWKTCGGTNNWGGMSLDTKRGWVFISTGSPAYDYYGGDRKGTNLFGNCLIALDAMTGKRIWHQQLVHHDIWDYDLPCQPALVRMRQGGRTFDAVVQMTKMGLVFIFDRETGKPVFGMEERPVPKSDVPGEELWPTQPFPLKPPPLNRLRFTADDATNIDPEAEAAIRKIAGESVTGSIYTATTTRGNIVHPGFRGGVLWGGCCYDPKLNRVFVSSSEQTNRIVLSEAEAGAGYRYRLTQRIRLLDPKGYPAIKPPWGYMTAIDLDKGDFAWRVVNGEYPELKARGILKTGTYADGGAIASAGELVFMAGTMDRMMRAFDSRTGRGPLGASARHSRVRDAVHVRGQREAVCDDRHGRREGVREAGRRVRDVFAVRTPRSRPGPASPLRNQRPLREIRFRCRPPTAPSAEVSWNLAKNAKGAKTCSASPLRPLRPWRENSVRVLRPARAIGRGELESHAKNAKGAKT